MALFGKKEAPKEKQAGSLIGIINYMKNQGYADDEIVEYLQNQGYNSAQIFDAMSQTEQKAEEKQPISGPPSMPSPAPAPAPMQAPAPMAEPRADVRERVEELAEAIIEEKWSSLVKNVEKIALWKDKTEERIAQLEQKMKDLKDQFDKLHTGVLGQISEYSKGVSDVGTEVKALSEVFKKTLPTFTQNIADLQRITKKLKTPKKSK